MNGTMPHIVQYQGPKRKLAPQILQYMPRKFSRCIEPFAGSAAITIAVAACKDVDEFIVNDLNEPLVRMLEEAVEHPQDLYEAYKGVWTAQFSMDSTEHFLAVRGAFNGGDTSPANMLYLLARCVKGSIRYNNEGKINQSCDKRRHGTKPETVYKNMLAVYGLLKGKATALRWHGPETLCTWIRRTRERPKARTAGTLQASRSTNLRMLSRS